MGECEYPPQSLQHSFALVIVFAFLAKAQPFLSGECLLNVLPRQSFLKATAILAER
jgi:hypothetical protein